jgi:glycogen(starch) synthase
VRLLFWTQHFWPHVGGVEVQALHHAEALRAGGHEVSVITSLGRLALPDRDVHRGIPIYRFPFLKVLAGRDLDALAHVERRLVEVLGDVGPELVHVQLTDPSVFFLLRAARGAGPPLVVTVPIALPEAPAGPDGVLSRALREARWVTAVSQAILTDVCRHAPDVAGRSSVIYCGLPEHPRPPAPLDPAAPPRVLCLGRLVPEKGFDLAVAAFERLAARHPRARLDIAGDGPARPALERQIRAAGLEARVQLLGWVAPERVPALMDAATVVVVPSRWVEALSLVAIQAAQRARAVVATDRGGLPEVVAHGDTGVIVPPADPARLAAALDGLLSDPDVAGRMGERARRRAREYFDLGRHVERYNALYEWVIRTRDEHGRVVAADRRDRGEDLR